MGNKGSPRIFIIIILAGLVVISLGFLELEFPEFVPLTLVSTLSNVRCDGIDCEWQLSARIFASPNVIYTDRIPIDIIDLEQPVVFLFDVATFSSLAGSPIAVTRTEVFIVTMDANGTENRESLTTLGKGVVDITSFLQGKTGFLELEHTGVTCASACVGTLSLRSTTSTHFGQRGVITSFTLDPPEIDETSSAFLRQKDFLAQSSVIESATRFAVAESFQLKTINATVITDFTMLLATQDPTAEVKGVIWDLNKSPPERVVESVETFNGTRISTVLGNIKFTFPVIALLADQNVVCVTTPCLPQPINYAVGIRVDQNLAQSFTYLQADGNADTHGAVIDRSPNLQDEVMFLDHGLIGIDINHDPAKGQELLDILIGEQDPEPVVCIAQFDPVCGVDAITYDNSCFADGAGVEIAHTGECTILDTMMNMTNGADDPTVIICEGISPEPPECQGVDTGSPTADQCGITEAFINGQCRCVEPFKRAENGQCGVVNESDKPPLLQIEDQITVETFIIAGAVIVGGGVTGLVLRARR
jgi:hypothetical protein